MEKLTAIYERTEDGWWVVPVPEIPGAHSQGRTPVPRHSEIADEGVLSALLRGELPFGCP